MTDYNTFKVPDLKAMLGQRKLLQTGNKQALIARLQEDDEKKTSEAKTDAKEDAKEDEITYSDDDATASKSAVEKPAPPASKSEPEEPAKSEEPVAPAVRAENSAKTAETEAAGQAGAGAETAEPAAPAPSFAIGLASTAVEDEAKKRAERAKRFGIEEDDEAKQRAERAKRFGLDQTELASGLDSALPERPLKRGRGRGADGDGNRHGKRQSLDRRGRPGGRGGKHDGGGSNNNANKGHRERGGDTLSAADRAMAEKRAARFATS
ncbi:hypothetical protein E4U53_002481 [Claviceps sorghi]|nr:hypothetical protein E4U53_002481 [Claviceps sorghi]